MTYLLLDTATPTCHLSLVAEGRQYDYSWEAGRELAEGLLKLIVDKLQEHDQQLDQLSGIGVMAGPGSFTGLRIGLTVANTLADSLSLPIVGVSGEDWQKQAVNQLSQGKNDQLVQPIYGAPAHITAPRK